MFATVRSTNFVRMFLLAVVACLLLTMAFSAISVQAKDGDVVTYGYLKSRPTGKIGTWTLNTKAGIKSFSATSATQLVTLNGPLVVGACTKVKQRLNSANQLYVQEISSQPARDCVQK